MPESPTGSVEVFADRVLRRPLWPHQAEAAGSDAFVTTIAAARRTGKTTLVETLAAWTCFRERNVKAVILSATQDSARRVTESIGQTLASMGETRDAVVDDFAMRIKLANGSEIVSLPASQRQVRGYGKGVKLLVIDEAGFVPEELWQAARYVALDEKQNGGRILLCGTPWGGPDLFFRRAFDAGMTGAEEHASFHWTHRANPNLDHGYLERERDRVSPSEYAAEVLGEWSDASGALFSRELLERCTADYVVLEPSAKEWRTTGPPVRLAAGMDWGVSFDRSAFVALGRLPVAALNPDRDVWPVIGVAGLKVWPAGAPLSDVWHEAAGAEHDFSSVSAETNGVGAAPTQELRRLVRERVERFGSGRRAHYFLPVTTTARIKTDAYGRLLGLMEQGRLVLPRHPDLLRQLAGLRFEQRERGFMSIEASHAAVHDDVADALAIALGPRIVNGQPKALVSTVLVNAGPDVVVASDDFSDTVTTGAGLVLPRLPRWQSMDGEESQRPGFASTAASDPATNYLAAVRRGMSQQPRGTIHDPVRKSHR